MARLYRAAFARQQQRHLGLLSTDPRLRRATKRRLITDTSKSVLKNPDSLEKTDVSVESPKKEGIQMKEFKISRVPVNSTDQTIVIDQTAFGSIGSLESKDFTEITSNLTETTDIADSTDESSTSDESSTKIPGIPQYLMSGKYVNGELSDSDHPESIISKEASLRDDDGLRTIESGNGTERIAESKLNSTNSRLRASGMGMVQVRMQNTTVLEDGSTRLIYSVHLGGKPVPAETAAKDMALLSPQEVALELGAPVIIQGERKLKFQGFYLGR